MLDPIDKNGVAEVTRRTLLRGLGCAAALAAFPAPGGDIPRIRMASNGHFSPLSFLDAQGQMRGLLVEELRLIGESAGLSFEFVDRPWARGQQMVRLGELDGFCTIPTQERQGYVLFAPTPLFVEESVFVARAGDSRAAASSTLEDIRALKIAEPLGTGWTKGSLQDDRVTWCSDIDNILAMIAAARVDGAFFGRSTAEAAMARFPQASQLRLRAFPAMPADEGYCFGLRKTFPDAAAWVARIDEVVRSLSAAGSFEPVRQRYLPPAPM